MSFGRSFPWRDSKDSYRLAVAEVLLQKTKAPDAEPVWSAVIERYPTAIELDRADPDDVHAVVASLGLGLQRTARLQRAARAIVSNEATPRLGPYGDAMVAMTLGNPIESVPIDGNVARVVQRLLGLKWDRGEPRKKPEVLAGARTLLEASGDGAGRLRFMYGLLDFGATVCTARRPQCAACPLASACVTHLSTARPDA